MVFADKLLGTTCGGIKKRTGQIALSSFSCPRKRGDKLLEIINTFSTPTNYKKEPLSNNYTFKLGTTE
jgi:hypothetical protein